MGFRGGGFRACLECIWGLRFRVLGFGLQVRFRVHIRLGFKVYFGFRFCLVFF